MTTLEISALLAGIVGSVVAILTVLALDLLKPQRFCPDCRARLPKIRRLKNARQRWHGGWTCPHCECEVSKHGQKILA